ncbi:prenyltransferase/squalene oxidase repeat-containing protein [Pirellulimonas nuda]|uniref:prenyltransferase/squalene oxidase repeat-containing protein n=1 Tax=Pirellulimonas nuda TaxID=2528009 RepID=UPI0011A98769|nr:prenyltransferase/squalene oxidase repeat-containing protein [Pirellulimonas nuda]
MVSPFLSISLRLCASARGFLRCYCAAAFPWCLLAGAALGQGELITPATDAAIDRGLRYLSGAQLQDGSFGTVGYGRNAAVVALGGMAMLGSGSEPGRGPYGKQLDRCIEYLMANTDASGFINADGASSHGPMYGHGFATLFLAEAYGQSDRRELRDKLESAVQLIISAQNDEGGWRYTPQPVDADLSVTICQIMALRAARNAGVFVPNQTVDRCIAYVRRCQNPDGGFGYTPQDRSSLFPRSAAGVVALYNAGVYEGAEIDRGLKYLLAQRPDGRLAARQGHFYYGQYYAVQAMWQAGGEPWDTWYPAVRDTLLGLQQGDGSWADSNGPQYGAAMALIVLQTPNDMIPIFQR